MLTIAGTVFDVSRGQDSPVRQQFHTRVTAVTTRMTVQELDAILSWAPFANVRECPDPSDEMTTCRAIRCLIAERYHPAPVLGPDALVPVAGQPLGSEFRFAPSLTFVAAEHHHAVVPVGLLTHQATQFFAVR